MKRTLLILTFLTLTTQLFATIHVVDSTNNSGIGSLRTAILNAAAGDTILFNTITNGTIITLTTGDIEITKPMVIIGNGQSNTIIDGNANSRIFEILSADSISINQLTMQNGAPSGTFPDNSGGAIYMYRTSKLTCNNVLITNNYPARAGGGIYAESNASTTIIIDSSTISYNKASNITSNKAGGIFLSSDQNAIIFVTNSTISYNTTNSSGGGIYISSGRSSMVTVDNSIVANNTANLTGGGIASISSNATFASATSNVMITNSTISNNSSGSAGGGVFSTSDDKSLVTIAYSTIYNNNAIYGGGISSSGSSYNNKSNVSSTVVVEHSTITENKGSTYAGGIHSDASSPYTSNTAIKASSVTVHNSTITNNNGEGIYVRAKSTSEINLKNNIIAFNSSSNIYDELSTPINSLGYNIFEDVSVAGSITTDQLGASSNDLNLGSLQNNGGTTETILPGCGSVALNMGNPSDSSDAQNKPILDARRDVGAAEGISETTKTVQNTNNTEIGSLREAIAGACPGDTIRFNPNLITSGNDTIVLTSEIEFNKGLIIIGLLNSTNKLIVSGNNSNRIFNVDLSSTTVKNLVLDSMFLINGKTSGNGGALNLIGADSLSVSNSTISESTSKLGGGVYTNSTSLAGSSSLSTFVKIVNSTISDNTASSNGGGIYTSIIADDADASVEILYSTISGNSSANNGGGIYINSTSFSRTLTSSALVEVKSSTISGNSTLNNGGGVYLSSTSNYASSSSSSVEVINSTISGNSANSAGGIYSSSLTPFPSTSIISLKSSIVAQNGSSNIFNNKPTTISSQGYNIFSESSITGSVSSDQLGVTPTQLNLGPLQYNGGKTKTLAPLFSSYAIDLGTLGDNSDAQNSPIIGRRDVGAAEYDTGCNFFASILPIAPGTYVSSKSTIRNGYVCFCDANNNLLLALDTTGSGAEILSNGVKLQIGSSPITSWTDTGGLVSNQYGGAIFNRKWDVSASKQPTTGDVKVRYFFTNAEYVALKDSMANHNGGAAGFPTTISAVTDLQMYKLNGNTPFADPHASGASGKLLLNGNAATKNTWVYAMHGTNNHSAEYLVSSFSGGGGGIGGGGAPLPVGIIGFTANLQQDESVSLKWTTSVEVNNSHFEVLRSTNGVDFAVVETINGAGNSNQTIHYSTTDMPNITGVKTLYYKLKQVDFNGDSTMSHIELIELDNTIGIHEFKADVYPMPLRDNFTISWNKGTTVHILLMDLTGKVVLDKQFSNATQKEKISMDNLATGVYILKVNNGQEFQSIKLIKE